MKIFGISPDNKFKEYAETSFKSDHQEAILETWLENNPDKIIEDGCLMMIGRQVSTNLGSYIDLLAIDRQGDLVVIELKRDRTPRETLSQALEYASFIEKLGVEKIEEIFMGYQGEVTSSFSQYHREFFQLNTDEAVVFNKDQRIVIIGQKITPEIRQTSSFLINKGLRITCLEFNFFQTNDDLKLLSTSIVISGETAHISRVS